MNNTIKRIKNSETLTKLGQILRAERERQDLSQAEISQRVRGLRQATVSKIERGGDVTVDTLISYATALKVELVFIPVGRRIEGIINASLPLAKASLTTPSNLLEEFADLKDEVS